MAVPPKKVTDRFVKELPRFQKILQAAKDRDINEADTVAIVKDMLSEVFGFDKYTEVTSEFCIRNTYCDLAVKLGDSVQYLIEVKAIGLGLKENHLRQAVNYGANQGIPWVVLTNGITWEIHKIRFEKPIEADQVCVIDVLTTSPRKAEDQERLFLLCREGISKAAMDDFAHKAQSVNRFVIGALLTGEPVVGLIKKELRKLVDGLKVESGEIEQIIRGEIIKREVFEGDPASKAKALIRKGAKQGKRPRPTQAQATMPLGTE